MNLDQRQRQKQLPSTLYPGHNYNDNRPERDTNKKGSRFRNDTNLIRLAVSILLSSFIFLHPSSDFIFSVKKYHHKNNNIFEETTVSTENERIIKNEILYIGKESVSSLLKKEKLLFDKQQKQKEESLRYDPNHKIDILVVSSKNSMELVQVQRETWASHSAIRHFFVSTEDDETQPKCRSQNNNINNNNETTTLLSDNDLRRYCRKCRTHQFWVDMKGSNQLTKYLKNQYASIQWIQKKKNPQGWLCVQRRFVTSFTSLVQLYSETKSLPDYLIVADDDTYVNIHHIVKDMIMDPLRRQRDDDVVVFPSFDTPVVTAGCRVRHPHQDIKLTFPYGGFGTFISKGSLYELIQPLHCNQTTTTTTMEPKCQKLLFHQNNNNGENTRLSYPLSATIGEGTYFKNGDSLNQIFFKYSRQVEYFCLHSDWFMGYMANFYNISQHTTGSLNNWFDNENENVQESRLYSFKDTEIYRRPTGQCRYSGESGGINCNIKSTVCHRVTANEMKRLHSKLNS